MDDIMCEYKIKQSHRTANHVETMKYLTADVMPRSASTGTFPNSNFKRDELAVSFYSQSHVFCLLV